jgi:DNA-binding GntR family transcriptional regulator
MSRRPRGASTPPCHGWRRPLSAATQLLVALSGSARLQRMASTLLVEARMCLAALTDTYVAPVRLVDEHSEIVAAIRSGDTSRALAILDEHMRDAVGRLTSTPDTAEDSALHA